MVSIDEPGSTLAVFENATEMVVDLKTMTLQTVDEAFREIGQTTVEYMDAGHEAGSVQDVQARAE
jgi:hypothetical protein